MSESMEMEDQNRISPEESSKIKVLSSVNMIKL